MQIHTTVCLKYTKKEKQVKKHVIRYLCMFKRNRGKNLTMFTTHLLRAHIHPLFTLSPISYEIHATHTVTEKYTW